MVMGTEWEGFLEVLGIKITMKMMKMDYRIVKDGLAGLNQGGINSQHGVEQCEVTKGDSFQPGTQPQLTRTECWGRSLVGYIE
jgi:hypothetical protein